nr:ribosomal protein S1 [Microheliella maris]BDN85885.1 ribosomal protein S1 [Microheliella maris]
MQVLNTFFENKNTTSNNLNFLQFRKPQLIGVVIGYQEDKILLDLGLKTTGILLLTKKKRKLQLKNYYKGKQLLVVIKKFNKITGEPLLEEISPVITPKSYLYPGFVWDFIENTTLLKVWYKKVLLPGIFLNEVRGGVAYGLYGLPTFVPKSHKLQNLQSKIAFNSYIQYILVLNINPQLTNIVISPKYGYKTMFDFFFNVKNNLLKTLLIKNPKIFLNYFNRKQTQEKNIIEQTKTRSLSSINFKKFVNVESKQFF